MEYGWSGLYAIGLILTPPAVTAEEQAEYANLALIPQTDNFSNSCDE